MLFLIYQFFLSEADYSVINKQNQTAYQPSGRITEGDGQKGVADVVRHNEKINLSEQNEGQQHRYHRQTAVTCTAQRTRIYLIYTAKQIKGIYVHKQRSRIGNYLGLGVEEGGEVGRKAHNGHHNERRNCEREQ